MVKGVTGISGSGKTTLCEALRERYWDRIPKLVVLDGDKDDLVLVTAVGYPRSGNRMKLIQTHAMADLSANMNWLEVSG